MPGNAFAATVLEIGQCAASGKIYFVFKDISHDPTCVLGTEKV